MSTYDYRLGVIFDGQNAEYAEYLQKQIDSLNEKLAEQNRKIELVEVTPENLDDHLGKGSFNGITYFSDMHKESNEYEQTLQKLVKLQNGVDIYPINHEREKDQSQEQLAEVEVNYIKSINRKSNVFPVMKVNNSNEMEAAANVMNLGAKTRLDKSTRVAENTNQRIEHLRSIVDKAIDQKHHYTSGHVARVSEYAVAIAKEMGYSNEKLQQLSISAQLHDIGKLGIQDDILASNKNLSLAERDEMAYHSILGPEILKCLVNNDPKLGKIITKDVIEGVGQHHKTWDGYNFKDPAHPFEPRGDKINEFALIICVADCLDTMTSQRAYNSPKDILNVVADLWDNRDKMFKQEIVEKGLIVIGKQLAQIGYDLSEFVPNTKQPGLEEFYAEHSEKFTPTLSTGKDFTDLGFKLDENGHFAFENGPAYDEAQSKENDIDFNFNKSVRETKENRKLTFQDKLPDEEMETLKTEAIRKVENQFETNKKNFKEALNRSREKPHFHSPAEIIHATEEKSITAGDVQQATSFVKEAVQAKDTPLKQSDFEK